MSAWRLGSAVATMTVVLAMGCGGSTRDDPGTGGSSSGPAPPALCSLPLAGGNCDAYMPMWGHDPDTGACVQFVYGGCGGNENRFSTREECLAACGGQECNDHADCQLIHTGCCGVCEPVSMDEYLAIPRTVTPLQDPMCSLVDCAECGPSALDVITSKFFYPACDAGNCVVRDVREQPITECASPNDCRLRCGAGCCESCGAGDDLIAVNVGANLPAEFCGDGDVACVTCDCGRPEPLGVNCIAGRCVVEHYPEACTPGLDQTCNLYPEMSSIAGTCNGDGTCTCNPGRTPDPLTGRCY
jgi:hypothetical protein